MVREGPRNFADGSRGPIGTSRTRYRNFAVGSRNFAVGSRNPPPLGVIPRVSCHVSRSLTLALAMPSRAKTYTPRLAPPRAGSLSTASGVCLFIGCDIEFASPPRSFIEFARHSSVAGTRVAQCADRPSWRVCRGVGDRRLSCTRMQRRLHSR